MNNEYKIRLGVELDTNSINTEIITAESKIKPIKITLDTDGIKSQINSIRQQIESLNNIRINLGGGTNGNIGENIAKSFNVNMAQIKATVKGTEGLMNGMRKALKDMKVDDSSINAAIKKIEEMNIAVSNVTAKLKGNNLDVTVKGIDDLGRAVSVVERFDARTMKLKDVSKQISQSFDDVANASKRMQKQTEAANKIKLKIDDGTFTNDISKINTQFNKLHNKTSGLRLDINMVKNALDDMITVSKTDDIDGLVNAYSRYEKVLKNVKNQLEINARAERENAANEKLVGDRAAFQTKIDIWLKNNSAAARRFGKDLSEIRAQAQACDRVTLNHLETEFKQIDNAAELAGLKTKTLADRLRHQFSRYANYLSIASVFMYGSMAIRDMFNEVVAIDSAMTELKKVTDETTSTYNEFLSNASARAKEIGATIDGLVSSTADFARLGYGFKDSQGLAEVANIYAVVGDEIDGVDEATQSLISTMTAFRDKTSDISNDDFAMDIVDKFNEVSNNFAISSGGIGEALQRSASSMAAANNTLDETIALITAANTVVQDPTVVGTAFKTISMRIRGAKTELEDAGLETEGMVESTAKLREEIMALSGVDIMLNKNEFKSTYQIIEELASKWEDLTDIQQASITELIAGKIFCQSVQKCA